MTQQGCSRSGRPSSRTARCRPRVEHLVRRHSASQVGECLVHGLDIVGMGEDAHCRLAPAKIPRDPLPLLRGQPQATMEKAAHLLLDQLAMRVQGEDTDRISLGYARLPHLDRRIIGCGQVREERQHQLVNHADQPLSRLDAGQRWVRVSALLSLSVIGRDRPRAGAVGQYTPARLLSAAGYSSATAGKTVQESASPGSSGDECDTNPCGSLPTAQPDGGSGSTATKGWSSAPVTRCGRGCSAPRTASWSCRCPPTRPPGASPP